MFQTRNGKTITISEPKTPHTGFAFPLQQIAVYLEHVILFWMSIQGSVFLSEQPVLITLLRVSFVSPWKPLPKGKRGGCGEGKTQLALSSSQDGKVDTGVITTSQVSPTFIVMPIIASNISLTIVIYKGLASVERFTNSPKWKFHYKTNMLMEIVLLQRHKNNAQKWPTNAFTVKLKD